MSNARGGPLGGIDVVLVDGNNLLGTLARVGETTTPAELAARLRAAIPVSVDLKLVLDGRPERAFARTVSNGVVIRHSGRRTADEVIVDEVALEEASSGPAAAAAILVVTDDGELRALVRRHGGRTEGTAWLAGRLARQGTDGAPRRLGAPHEFAGRPAPSDWSDPSDGDDDDRPRWHPGRGATVKRGNPRPASRRSRHC
jgi:hypothetical protein